MTPQELPKWASIIIWFLTRPGNRSTLAGDVEEEFNWQLADKGRFRANLWCVMQILNAFFHFLGSHLIWSAMMFKNYIKVSLRNIRRHKGFAFINIFGLMLGLAIFTLFSFNIATSTNADLFHENGNRIYSIIQKFTVQNDQDEWDSAYTPAPMLPAMQELFPEIEQGVRVFHSGKVTITRENDKFYENKLLFVDTNFFDVFTFDLIYGDKERLLTDRRSIVISEASAKKYFGEVDPRGKRLLLENKIEVTVTGVTKDLDLRSSLDFEFIVDMQTAEQLYDWERDWQDSPLMSFVLLKNDTKSELLEEKFPDFIADYMTDENTAPEKLYLFKLYDFRLYAGHISSFMITQHKLGMYVVFLIGVLLLVVVGINFVNLSTARYMDRIKEVGMRKVVGATRWQLTGQFLGESVLLTLIAIPGAIIIYELLWQYMSSNFYMEFDISIRSLPFLLKYLGGGALLTGIFAGAYPAFFLSAFSPMQSLKSGTLSGKGKMRLRKFMVVSQFTVSAMLIILTLHLKSQFDFIFSADLGYNKDDLLVVESEGFTFDQVQLLQSELSRFPEVTSVSASAYLPAIWTARTKVFTHENGDADSFIYMSAYGVDYEFLKTMQIEVIEGKDLEKDDAGENNLLISERAVERLGWNQPIGKQLTIGSKTGNIIGVVSDFHFRHVVSPNLPAVIFLKKSDLNYVYAKLRPGTPVKPVIDRLGDRWTDFSTVIPFNSYAYTDKFNDIYDNLRLTGFLLLFAGIVTVSFSSIGLFGLVSYTVNQRTKEIGIRKVLGSTVKDVVWKLSTNFFYLSVISIIIAIPLAHIFSNRILQTFAVRININYGLFAAGIGLMIVTTLIAVLSQTLKASRANPVDSLRYE